MAAIVISNLVTNVSGALYKDLKLDLTKNYTQNTELLKNKEIKDITLSEDVDAIKNSLFNLFNTMPGQKILNPIYGLNLMQYLFTGITEANARALGEAISFGIKKFEPRITLVKLNIDTDYDNNQYGITMAINIPTLKNKTISLKGILSESGYYFN